MNVCEGLNGNSASFSDDGIDTHAPPAREEVFSVAKGGSHLAMELLIVLLRGEEREMSEVERQVQGRTIL